jgi:Winged helix-turn helix
MTVIAMSRTEIDRMSVLHDLAGGRIRIAEASALMGLGRRQVFRLAKAYGKHGLQALVSRRRGRPSNRCYPTALRAEVIGIIRERYSDFGPALAAKKLAELHENSDDITWDKQLLDPASSIYTFNIAVRAATEVA